MSSCCRSSSTVAIAPRFLLPSGSRSLSRLQPVADLLRVHAERLDGPRRAAVVVAQRGEQEVVEPDRLLAAGDRLPQDLLEHAPRVARDALLAPGRLVVVEHGVLDHRGLSALAGE